MIVVFGGSFNPPSLAHINIAKAIFNINENISKVIIVPVSDKYEKNDLIPFKYRYDMLKIATKDYSFIEISNVENISDRQLNTYETLDIIKTKYPGEDIAFLLGADNLNYFTEWTNSEYILKNYFLLAIEREGYKLSDIINNNDMLLKYKTRIKTISIDTKLFKISSTKIRENIDNFDKIHDYIDVNVFEYIKQNELYKKISA